MTKTLEERSSEDFKFMVLCESKGNMSLYRLLRDPDLTREREQARVGSLEERRIGEDD